MDGFNAQAFTQFEMPKESEEMITEILLPESVIKLEPATDLFYSSEPKDTFEKLLDDYLEAESDAENDSDPHNDEADDNLSVTEGSTNDAVPASTNSGKTSKPLYPTVPNTLAAKSLPDGLSLRCTNLANAVHGVFTTRAIKRDTILGPYVGVRIFDKQVTRVSGRTWKIFMNNKLHHYIDSQDHERSNWMRYVNRASHFEGQNLEAFQVQYKIYYRAIATIHKNTELLVWPSKNYNQDRLKSGSKMKWLVKKTLSQIKTEPQDSEHVTLNGDAASTATAVTVGGNVKVKEVQRAKLRSDTKQSENPHSCDVCGKSFRLGVYLKRHTKVHLGDKPHVCHVCNATFARKSNLRQHAMRHTGERPHKCEVCNATFSHSSVLKEHRMIHTGEKPYKCSVCTSAFTHKTSLRMHMRIHTGERPFKCNLCSATFALSSHLRQHSKIHTGEKKHNCDKCVASFAQKAHLQRHLRTHTDDKPNT